MPSKEWWQISIAVGQSHSLSALLQLTRGIEKTVAKLVERLAETSTEVTDEGLADVATVSAGNNRVVRIVMLSRML